MTRRISLLFGLLGLLVALGGCSHYHLGTSGPLVFSSLYVAPVKMRALVPQAKAIIGTQLREAFIHDGRLTLANDAATADATLTLTIKDYHREVATVRPGDTGLARKFIITVKALATLTDNRTGQTLFSDRPLQAQRDVYTDSGQQQAEYQMLPLLAQDLAARASHAVLDTW